MIVGRQHLDLKRPLEPLHIDVFDQRILESTSIKLLGINIDNALTFSNHITSLIARCTSTIRFLWRTAKDRTFQQKKLLANALVMPHLQYCCVVYHRHITKHFTTRLNSVQYRLMRFITGAKRDERISSASLSTRLKWLPLDKYREMLLQEQLWKIKYDNKTPTYLHDCINREDNRHATRHGATAIFSTLNINRTTLNSIFCKSLADLPRSVTQAKSISKLRKNYISMCL